MKTNLKYISNIQTGIFAKPLHDGEVVYLQAKHFDENGLLNSALHTDLKKDFITVKHLLRPGDVLFAAKGTKNFAAVYESHNLPAVASTSFFVIRLFEENILPEYLTWFLNHSATQKTLKSKALGSSMPSIAKSSLDDLEINIPSLEVQKKIVRIAELRNIEKNLKQRIESLREKQLQHQISSALK